MSQLAPVQLEDGTVIYIETTANVDVPDVSTEEPEETGRLSYGLSDDLQKQAIQGFQAIESTIRAYTTHTLNAFKQMPSANINKVTLQFGITVAGEAGVPYVTKGSVASNINITVECSFPKDA